jgi:TetR/AcrR family transcriptional regulator, fatty acid biosynthesis regulator
MDVARGKALLIEAAVKLASKTGNFSALSVREIGKEAGLNPNTFYRHFASLEALGFLVLDLMVSGRRQPLREIRRHAAEAAGAQLPHPNSPAEYWACCLRKAKAAARLTIEGYFDYVTAYPETFLIGISGIAALSPGLREKLDEAIGELASDLADDIRIYQLLPMLSDEAVRSIALLIVKQTFLFSTDYINTPGKREETRRMALGFVMNLIAGSIALEVTDKDTMISLVEILRSAG